MFSKYERQKDKRPYNERHSVYTGPQYINPPERIKPTKYVKFQEGGGMPSYEDIPEGGIPPPAAAPAPAPAAAEAGEEE